MENDNETVTADAFAVQAIEENEATAKQYASGDLAALEILRQKARALAGGRVPDDRLSEALMRKLGPGI